MRIVHLPSAWRPASTAPRKARSWKASSQAPCFTHPGVRGVPCRRCGKGGWAPFAEFLIQQVQAGPESCLPTESRAEPARGSPARPLSSGDRGFARRRTTGREAWGRRGARRSPQGTPETPRMNRPTFRAGTGDKDRPCSCSSPLGALEGLVKARSQPPRRDTPPPRPGRRRGGWQRGLLGPGRPRRGEGAGQAQPACASAGLLTPTANIPPWWGQARGSA